MGQQSTTGTKIGQQSTPETKMGQQSTLRTMMGQMWCNSTENFFVKDLLKVEPYKQPSFNQYEIISRGGSRYTKLELYAQ
jgi:hypothetical protein